MNAEKVVYIVHAVDTEGPLYESLTASFARLKEIFGHRILPSPENLVKLKNKEIDLNGDEEKVAQVLADEKTTTHASWDQIDQMLDEITSDEYREKLKDSYGGGWVFNWFCMDHVGMTGINPRRRDMGYHNIFDHYREYLDSRQIHCDQTNWHYHPLSITNDAHRAGSTYLNSDHVYGILSRRIIDRSWFPAAFRPGFHTERPDSHFFLEQWIPFDFGNDSSSKEKVKFTVSEARYGDWRRAPKSWIPYHPAHDDYQSVGNCRRYIARCLSINERAYSITSSDVSQAFDEADKHGASLLSFTNHDFRDMRPDIQRVRELIKACQQKYPDINFKFSTAIKAMRAVLGMKEVKEIGLNAELSEYKTHTRLIVETENKIFGPQPYLALKDKGDNYYWQNFDFEGRNTWSYSFDRDNILIDQIAAIGVAANTSRGLTEIVNIDPATGTQQRTVLNK